jgi:hypothetical protein
MHVNLFIHLIQAYQMNPGFVTPTHNFVSPSLLKPFQERTGYGKRTRLQLVRKLGRASFPFKTLPYSGMAGMAP